MRQERKAAAFKGLVHYHGHECKNCGGTHRYVSTGNCVECSKKSGIKSRANIKALLDEARRKAGR